MISDPAASPAADVTTRGEGGIPPLRVCLLCLGVINDDPRVRKQGNLLHGFGLAVVAAGFVGGTAPDPEWPICGVPARQPRGRSTRLCNLLRRPHVYARHYLSKVLQPLAGRSDTLATLIFWQQEPYQRLFRAARGIAAEVYVANDWHMLPIAARLARLHGGRFVYDSHEYAAEELPESLYWRLFSRPLATTIERLHIRDASVVSTVSKGIARHLQRDHHLHKMPLVVRNVPEAAPGRRWLSPLRRRGELTLLFHGALTEMRGLHVLVESVRFWHRGLRLVLRGPIAPAYRDRLQDLIAQFDLKTRVAIVPPVAADRLVVAAAEADVGVVCLPDTSLENRLALPNKVFEYIAAGLALLVPYLDELQGVVAHYGNGLVFARLQPAAIAEAVN